MFKSSRRDRAGATMDRIGGKILHAVGELTGRSSYKVKGKAASARGAAKRRKGQMKRAVR